ncbi:hypothetical protein IAD21_06214 [Abditibacteriota bacterium]|nr:hypothetical protein IAD21_06214 [Abditibacteriota bacterium]
MNRLRRYRQLSPQRRRALRQATWLVGLARLMLWSSSLKIARKFLPMAARCIKPQGASPELEVEIWAVNVAGHFVPCSTCLVKAVALHTLLERYGEPAQLHIGVAKGAGDQLLAHAWVQQEDRVLVGGEESNRYTLLLSMK